MADNKKTLQDFKDEVAKECTYKGVHYQNWDNMQTQLLLGVPESSKVQSSKDLLKRLSEAAERYALYLAGQGWEEGWKAALVFKEEDEKSWGMLRELRNENRFHNPYKQKGE